MNSNVTVDVSNLKSRLVDKICALYNAETFFIASCQPHNSKYSEDTLIKDLQLEIFLEENNKIMMCGELVKYCNRGDNKRKVKLADITDTVNQPEVNIYHNHYIINNS